MVFQRDRDGGPDAFETGLPRAHSGEDIPKWLVGLGAAAGLTLLVALLRYAIDLLGVVFVIILVGFAIRSLSDWLTEGQSVSAWAITALSMGLFGTVLVGLWLFNSRDYSTEGFQAPLPGPMAQAVGWMESHGWGQRVLLPGSSVSGSMSGGLARRSGPRESPVETSTPAEPVAMAAPPTAPSESRGAVARLRRADAGRRKGPSEAEAAPLPAPAPVAAPAAQPSVSPTSLGLVVSPSPAVVGRSVRLTAQLNASLDAGRPTGLVIFSADDRVLGRAPVRDGVAVLVTLDLELGDHMLSAAYEGDGTHLPSRSEPVRQTVSRK